MRIISAILTTIMGWLIYATSRSSRQDIESNFELGEELSQQHKKNGAERVRKIDDDTKKMVDDSVSSDVASLVIAANIRDSSERSQR